MGVPDRSRLCGEIAGRPGSKAGARSHNILSDYQVLARKWRPQTFEAVVGQDAITRTVKNALTSGRIAHAYLFAGPRGVGKTTTARLLARALLCPDRSGAEEDLENFEEEGPDCRPHAGDDTTRGREGTRTSECVPVVYLEPAFSAILAYPERRKFAKSLILGGAVKCKSHPLRHGEWGASPRAPHFPPDSRGATATPWRSLSSALV